jgi:hypothetical protein
VTDKSVKRTLRTLNNECAKSHLNLAQAIDQKAAEVFFRRLYLCIPDLRLKGHQLEQYLRDILHDTPSEELMEWIQRDGRRRRRLSDDEYLELERRQNARCAVCGIPLVSGVRPRVDHILPISLRGLDDLSNFQLLCHLCNAGKGGYPHWIAAAPFFHVCKGGPDLRVRYCVLSRDESCCTQDTCDETARSSELRTVMVIGIEKGGRVLFDNLRTVCVYHFDQIRVQRRRAVEDQVRRMRWASQSLTHVA